MHVCTIRGLIVHIWLLEEQLLYRRTEEKQHKTPYKFTPTHFIFGLEDNNFVPVFA